MSAANLFSRLADYSLNPRKRSLENFTTELLAHFFNTDPVFKRRFIDVIFDDLRLARPFRKLGSEATTQEALGKDCRVDLTLWSGRKAHLVEVKIDAPETISERWGQTGKPQLQRYLELGRGNVTYLTTRESLAPDVDQRGRRNHRFVKHALFEDLYGSLRTTHLRPLTQTLVEFMKSNGLAAPHPIVSAELKKAERAMEIVQKFKDTLAIVRTEVNSDFRDHLRTRAKLTRPAHQAWDGGGEVYSYLRKFKSKTAIRSVGLSLTPVGSQVYFYVWAWGIIHPSVGRIRDWLGWGSYDGDRGILNSVRLRGNHGDTARMVEHARQSSRALGKAIRKFT